MTADKHHSAPLVLACIVEPCHQRIQSLYVDANNIQRLHCNWDGGRLGQRGQISPGQWNSEFVARGREVEDGRGLPPANEGDRRRWYYRNIACLL